MKSSHVTEEFPIRFPTHSTTGVPVPRVVASATVGIPTPVPQVHSKHVQLYLVCSLVMYPGRDTVP